MNKKMDFWYLKYGIMIIRMKWLNDSVYEFKIR